MAKFILLAVLALVLIAAVVSWQGRQYEAFAARAGKTGAKLLKKEERNFRPNQYTGRENWVQYTYTVEGRTYDGQEKIEYPDLWHGLAEGQEIEVYYDKENPGVSHPVAVIDKRLGIASHLKGQGAH